MDSKLFIPSENTLFAVDLQGKLILTKRVAEGNLNSISTDGEKLFVGSDDGNLYALDSEGSVIWKFKTNNSIKTSPLALSDTIIFASRDNYIYSVDKNGNLIWKLQLSDWPNQFDYRNGIIYLSSYDGTIYAISTLNCRITNPEANSTILPLVSVVGDAYSEYNVSKVQVRTLPGEWQDVSLQSSGKNISWSGRIQVTGFSEGPVSLQCRVIDSNGNEEISPFTTLDYNFVFSEEKLPKINVSYQSSVNVNQPIILKFFTQEGTILTDLTVTIGGEKFKVSDPTGQFAYTPKSEGKFSIYIEKSGYQQRQIEINVTKPLIQPIYVLIIFIIAIAVVIYSSIRKGTWR
jgi:outer membrane protein assembly factor BamB